MFISITKGMRQAVPIVFGYIPIGFAYGVLAQKSGLGVFAGIGMSALVFAGSAQLIAVGLFAAGASALSILITTFVVNLRHLLMSAALAPKLNGWKKWQIALFGFQMTDETFALHSSRMAKQQPAKSEIFALNVTAQSSWILGSAFGFFMGGQITDVAPVGLDFALPAMFIALLVPHLVKPVTLAMAALAGALSVALFLLGFSQSHVIVATIVCATLGLMVEQWIKK